jgi:hypothetical protein
MISKDMLILGAGSDRIAMGRIGRKQPWPAPLLIKKGMVE